MKICIKCVFLTMLLLIICSCRQQKQRIINLSIQRDTLQAINQRQETQLQELQSYVETMTMSLDSIAIEEGMLFLPDPEKPNSPLSKKQLKVRLQRFEELVDRQHAKIKELEDSLDMSNATLSNMKSLISYFRATLEQKEVEIEDMKKTLLQKNESIKKLTKEVKTLKDDVTNLEETTEQQQVIMDVQDEILNEGYYIVKSRKELAAMGIRSAKLSDAKIDLSQFIKVDIRTLSALNISTSRISILTPMPTNSYSIVKNSDGTSTLQINSPADFWQYSNILIIQTR